MKKMFAAFIVIVLSGIFLFACKGGSGPAGGTGGAGPTGRGAYLTAQAVNLEIQSAQIAPDGKASATFRITDQNGLPLDRTGLYTEGTVTASFVLSWLDQDSPGSPRQYTAYTTMTVTSPITLVSTSQPASDAGGTFTELGQGNGTYTYSFNTLVPAGHLDLTHTVAVSATRAFGGKTYSANATYNFVPTGAAVATTREIVLLDSCNTCHGELRAHTWRKDTRLCITCHSTQAMDPDTGNTVDFAVLIHKIHRGRNLPSVVAGSPYQIIGDQQAVNDYSTVGYSRELENCGVCHTGAQGDRWKTNPSRAICASCHDLTSFEPGVLFPMIAHTGGPRDDDSQCTICHPPAGGLSGITDKHLTPLTDPASPVLVLQIQSVASTAPGQTPTVTFQVTRDGLPLNILATPLNRLTATIAGPTTDYATSWQSIVQGSGAVGTLSAVDAANGVFSYTFPGSAPIPATATGSYAVGFEGFIQPGGVSTPMFPVTASILSFAVTDATTVPRRTVVSDAACNGCHGTLTGHNTRRGVQYCVLCHNPNATNSTRVARLESSTIVAQSMDLKVLVHKIHRGIALSQPYVIGGLPAPSVANPSGTPIDFGASRYPQDLRNCAACHLPGTYDLPLSLNRLPSIDQTWACTENPADDTNSYCETLFWAVTNTSQTPATAAACTSCHDSTASIAHAQVNTTGAGVESCAVCHKAGAAYGLDVVHCLAP